MEETPKENSFLEAYLEAWEKCKADPKCGGLIRVSKGRSSTRLLMHEYLAKELEALPPFLKEPPLERKRLEDGTVIAGSPAAVGNFEGSPTPPFEAHALQLMNYGDFPTAESPTPLKMDWRDDRLGFLKGLGYNKRKGNHGMR